MRRKLPLLFVVVGLLLITHAFSQTAQGQLAPLGDYGDAPDNLPCGYNKDPFQDKLCKFPTLFATTNARIPEQPGAHTLELGQEALGFLELVSAERDADAPDDPDQTPNLVDDDLDDGLIVELLPEGRIRFKVHVRFAETAPPVTRYLNALYDLDRNGSWQGKSEWIMKNQQIRPNPDSTGSRQQVVKEIEIPSRILVDEHPTLEFSQPRWLRLALTREPISETRFADVGGWDGSGQFTAGEIEDHKIGAVRASDFAQAADNAFLTSWASAYDHAQAFEEAEKTAQDQMEAIEIAAAAANAAASAVAAAQANAAGITAQVQWALDQAQVQIEEVRKHVLTLPCSELILRIEAIAEATSTVITLANAVAVAAAAAAADAAAWAVAQGQAISEAHAQAQAAATALAAASAQAQAKTQALAVSRANARAWADAQAQALATGQFPAQASTLALGWAQAKAWASAWANAQATARAWASASAHVQAIAAAQARAQAVASAAAEAAAAARAAVAVATAVATNINQILTVIARIRTAFDIRVIEDCCRQASCCRGGSWLFGDCDTSKPDPKPDCTKKRKKLILEPATRVGKRREIMRRQGGNVAGWTCVVDYCFTCPEGYSWGMGPVHEDIAAGRIPRCGKEIMVPDCP